MNWKALIIALGAAVALAGCAHKHDGMTTVAGGESRVFERPPYEVRGKTTYDQNWIDNQVEGGVAAYGWDRPGPRPPEIDALPAPKVVASPPKKKKLWARVKSKFKKGPSASGAQPLASLSAKPVTDAPTPLPPLLTVAPLSAPSTAGKQPDPAVATQPPTTFRDRVDELLLPSSRN